MQKIRTFNDKGEPLSAEIECDDSLLELHKGDQALQDVVVAHQAARRAGTACTLSKGEVAGSNRKPWRQKGTGRARAGYRQSPVWRGGGVAFGPKPRDYGKKINRKVSDLALRRAFTLRVTEGAIRVIESFEPEAAKTRWLTGLLKRMDVDRSCLILAQPLDPLLIRIARNIPWVSLSTAGEVDVYTLMRHRTILMSRAAFEALSARVARPVAMEQHS